MMLDSPLYLREVALRRDTVPDFLQYPFNLPAVSTFDRLAFDHPVTFLIGENGSGKSTLLEAIAVALGFNAEGGSRNFVHRRHTFADPAGLSQRGDLRARPERNTAHRVRRHRALSGHARFSESLPFDGEDAVGGGLSDASEGRQPGMAETAENAS
jgi:predicted ATPase